MDGMEDWNNLGISDHGFFPDWEMMVSLIFIGKMKVFLTSYFPDLA